MEPKPSMELSRELPTETTEEHSWINDPAAWEIYIREERAQVNKELERYMRELGRYKTRYRELCELHQVPSATHMFMDPAKTQCNWMRRRVQNHTQDRLSAEEIKDADHRCALRERGADCSCLKSCVLHFKCGFGIVKKAFAKRRIKWQNANLQQEIGEALQSLERYICGMKRNFEQGYLHQW